MAYALEMFFDDASEKMILEYFNKLKELGINSYLADINSLPHITLGIYHDIEPEKSFPALKDLCTKTEKFRLILPSVGVFTHPKPCVFLSPVVTTELLEFHRKARDTFDYLNHKGFDYYSPDNWVPHCAVDISDDINVVCKSTDYILKNFAPFVITVEKIGWAQITKPIKRLATYELK